MNESETKKGVEVDPSTDYGEWDDKRIMHRASVAFKDGDTNIPCLCGYVQPGPIRTWDGKENWPKCAICFALQP